MTKTDRILIIIIISIDTSSLMLKAILVTRGFNLKIVGCFILKLPEVRSYLRLVCLTWGFRNVETSSHIPPQISWGAAVNQLLFQTLRICFFCFLFSLNVFHSLFKLDRVQSLNSWPVLMHSTIFPSFHVCFFFMFFFLG